MQTFQDFIYMLIAVTIINTVQRLLQSVLKRLKTCRIKSAF